MSLTIVSYIQTNAESNGVSMIVESRVATSCLHKRDVNRPAHCQRLQAGHKELLVSEGLQRLLMTRLKRLPKRPHCTLKCTGQSSRKYNCRDPSDRLAGMPSRALTKRQGIYHRNFLDQTLCALLEKSGPFAELWHLYRSQHRQCSMM